MCIRDSLYSLLNTAAYATETYGIYAQCTIQIGRILEVESTFHTAQSHCVFLHHLPILGYDLDQHILIWIPTA